MILIMTHETKNTTCHSKKWEYNLLTMIQNSFPDKILQKYDIVLLNAAIRLVWARRKSPCYFHCSVTIVLWYSCTGFTILEYFQNQASHHQFTALFYGVVSEIALS